VLTMFTPLLNYSDYSAIAKPFVNLNFETGLSFIKSLQIDKSCLFLARN
jgi:hypothetical protein